MSARDGGEYWWSDITGPREVVTSTIDALRAGKNIILHVPHDLPWRRELRRSVRNGLESIPGLEELFVYMVDVEEEGEGETEPGRLILDKYGLKEDKMKFREGGRETIQEYLLRKNVMRNRLVWVKGITPGGAQAWASFCERWRPQDPADGIFVIEAKEQPQVTRSGGVRVINYDDFVSEYDAQLFNSLLLEEDRLGGLSSLWKRFASSISTHLCGTDAEIARSFILQHNFRKDDPIETIGEIADSGAFDCRGNGSHVLALFRAGNIMELRKRVWAAQVEVLFPLIERQRLEIVDVLSIQLDSIIKKGLFQFDNEIEKPEDVELGTMVYLLGSRQLNVPDKETRERIHTLRECRNLLAHRDVCNLEQVEALFDY